MLLQEDKKTTLTIDLLALVGGTAISAFALNSFTIPAGLIAGGLTGISQFINHFIPLNVGLFYLLLNIPLMILGYLFLGKKFSIYTILAIILISLFLVIFPIGFVWTDNLLLCAIFGGAINGIGCAIVLRRGGSQGGLDILSRIIAKKKNITVGKANLFVNLVIVSISGYIFGAELALYTIISMMCTMKLYEIILNHVNRVTMIIITEHGEAINERINVDLHRGTTMWNANGGYTHHQKAVLYCVIVEGELSKFKKIVNEVDPTAFVSVISTQQVIGRFVQSW